MVRGLGPTMFTIERKTGIHWQPEIQRKTEFKAFVDARTKCMATGPVSYTHLTLPTKA